MELEREGNGHFLRVWVGVVEEVTSNYHQCLSSHVGNPRRQIKLESAPLEDGNGQRQGEWK